jgi:dUTP pyrophosphatase
MGYDVYALRAVHQPVNQDGTPVSWIPAKPGMPTKLDMQGKIVRPIRIESGKPTIVETGIAVHFVKDDGLKYGLEVEDRSSIASKGLHIVAGKIDAGYRGELKIIFTLVDGSYIDLWPGDKIAQLVPRLILADTVEVVDALEDSARKEGGFGSSGV